MLQCCVLSFEASIPWAINKVLIYHPTLLHQLLQQSFSNLVFLLFNWPLKVYNINLRNNTMMLE